MLARLTLAVVLATSGATGEAVLAAPAVVRLCVVDALGREAARLADGPQPAGALRARWDVRGLAPGVYAVVLDVAGAPRRTLTVTVVRR